ncbi:AAA family ATPase [Candidatus Bathyarchaeota archaeon]|nr:AAA family ATPase [Candidatus Bathyarchaeota archaeon]
MLTELKINNFKGIGSCSIKDLGQVNLFIGKNDSGKSTVLEAAYYLFQELTRPPHLRATMSKRSDVPAGISELWFNYETSSPVEISTDFDGVRINWRIILKHALPENTVSSNLFAGRTQVILLGENQYRERDFVPLAATTGNANIANIKESVEFRDKLTQYSSNMFFIDCTLKSHIREIESILARFKRVPKLESGFGEILDDVYGKGRNWEFIPQLEYPEEKRLAIKEAGRQKYFAGFGDGLRCCVGILGAAMSVKSTAIFIEEIESHQHSGSLSKIVKHLVRISRENHLQIFLSTHSKDVWESLYRGVYLDDEKREKEEFRCFLLERNPDDGKVTAECTNDLQKITQALQ